MSKKGFLLALLLATVLHLQAVTVNSTAGKLATMVTNHNATELTVNGTIDARDFAFIADEMPNINTLNLANATIVAYNSTLNDGLLPGEHHYAANTMPYCALAGVITLKNVTLPSNLTAIDYGAFAGCTGITAIGLPATLLSIGDDAFNTCSSLTQVSITGSINHLGSKAFAHCAKLATVIINPSGPITIGDEAFANCQSLNNVTIGAAVTHLGNGTFTACKALKKINIAPGSKLESIGDMTFYNSGLEELNMEDMPRLKHLGAWALARTNLKELTLPAHVKSLDQGTLFYNNKLTSLELPSTLTYLPDYMLAGCDNINGTQFMTPSLGNIGDFAIYNQQQHGKITVPQRVYYIGSYAMAGIKWLYQITSEPLQAPELGNNVWAGIKKSRVNLYVNEESLDNYRAAEQWQDFLIDVAQLRGDVNCDGFVNTLDAIAERRFLVNGITEGINTSRTDVTASGNTDVADIVAIYNIINGVYQTERPMNYWFSDYFESMGFKTSAKKAKIEFSLDNSINYNALQFDIVTPSHITIDDAKVSGRGLAHEIHLGLTGGNEYRLVSYSPTGDDFEGNSGVIVTLYITSTNTITNDDFITLSHIYFADGKENVYHNKDIIAKVLGISAIDNITIDSDEQPVNVYNTQGQLLRQNVSPAQATNGLPAGIYIVGNKKVIVR